MLNSTREVLSVLPNYAFFKGHVVPYKEANVGILTHALNYGIGGVWRTSRLLE